MGSRPAPWRASNGSRRAREATRASAECGARNAELQWRVLHVWQAGRPDARRDIPHSTFRIPHLRKGGAGEERTAPSRDHGGGAVTPIGTGADDLWAGVAA